MTPVAIGFIGFGEAGSRIALGLRESGVTQPLFAYDIADSAKIRDRAEAAGVTLLPSNEQLATRCEILLSLVTASSALEAARQNAPYLRAGQTYVDCNSVSPAKKRELAEVIASTPAEFVEAAILAPVPKRKGQAVPMLIDGTTANGTAEALNPLGFSMEPLDAAIGTAAAVKMCRSIVVKGLEAILTECVLAASEFGAEDRVFASLQQSFPGIDWQALADYMVNRVVVHGERRAREMEEVAATLRAIGVEPIMSEAAARRQEWSAKLGLAAGFGPEGPSTYREVLDSLKAAAAKS